MVLPPQGGRAGAVAAGPSGRDPASARGNAPMIQGKRPAAATAAAPADSAESDEATAAAPYMRGTLIDIQA